MGEKKRAVRGSQSSAAQVSRRIAAALGKALAVVLVLVAASVSGACEQVGSYYTCENPAKGTGDPCPEPRPVEDCRGQCVPSAPLGWSQPALLWFGPPDEAPECPKNAPILGYEGYADLGPMPNPCQRCGCEPGEASCALPSGWTAHAASFCPGPPGTAETSFAAPAGWDGSCTDANAIPAGELCDGQPCVQSLSIEAPTVTAGPCAAVVVEPPMAHDLPYPWGTLARACVGMAYPPCADPGNTCAPAPPSPDAPPPAGFVTCIFHEGERSCPKEYPVPFVFHGGIEDLRECTPCACGDPEGASCSVLAGAFSDGSCSAVVAQGMISSAAPACHSGLSGAGLGSKSATVIDIDPGGCPPQGGEPVGEVMPAQPATFCCGS